MLALALCLASIAQPDPLAHALYAHVSFSSGGVISHCRRAPAGCWGRVASFARMFRRAGREHGVSPWLLAALAVRESSLNPYAEGDCGKSACRGIMQVHERSRGAPRFVWSDARREACREIPGTCQAPVVDFAARRLRRHMAKCGSVDRALRRYSTGKCGGRTRLPRLVMRRLRRMRERALRRGPL